MKALWDKLVSYISHLSFVCTFYHQDHWEHWGRGCFRVQRCNKCEKNWVVDEDRARGKHIETLF